ncbi:hypothetical protein [Undibacterium flavidum]|uniref:Uncharacterized protein n=1 Tax=Undibacterium flavidum TaxID=2762297 RepID=A0ABR6YHC2_9BURK|nr:hypothetical protein [Undibacterium flavidum]MBC3875912.1 hypothetical protein [Undibacterium flavidum]
MKPSASQSGSNNACQHLSIANSKIGEIMICPECSVIHLSLQSISIRLDLDAFSELAKMIKHAQATIEQAQEQAQKFSSNQANPSNDLHDADPLAHEALLQENAYPYYPHKVH